MAQIPGRRVLSMRSCGYIYKRLHMAVSIDAGEPYGGLIV